MFRLHKAQLDLPEHQLLREKDERELYTHNPHDYYAVNYRTRIQRIITTILKSGAASCLEIGSAQATMSLQLAERSLRSVALDYNHTFLTYAGQRKEHGCVHFVCGSGTHLPVVSESFDALICGEIVEHMAWPEHLLAEAFRCLKPGGLCVLTTPNHDSLLNTQTSFSEVAHDRTAIEQHQFGPDGDDHLFAFSLFELTALFHKAGFEIVSAGYHGSHFLMVPWLYHIRHACPFLWTGVLEWLVTHIPGLGRRWCHGLFITARRPAA